MAWVRFFFLLHYDIIRRLSGVPGGSNGIESACTAGDPGSVPGLGRSPAEGNGNPLQYSFLQNSKDRGALWSTVPPRLRHD